MADPDDELAQESPLAGEPVGDTLATDDFVGIAETDDGDWAEPKQKLGARGVVVLSARVLAGAIGTAVAAAAILGATFVPLPSHTVGVPSELVTPVSTSQQRVCAGPLLRLGDDTGAGATQASSFGRPNVRSASNRDSVDDSALPTTENTLSVAPTLLSVPASAKPVLFAGSQTQAAASGDIVGLAAADCPVGGADSWLVGGSTATGRTTLITLSNPSGVSSTVSLTTYSAQGIVVGTGTDGIVVPAGAQRIFSLAAFAPGIEAPVVHVESRGGPIVANLQQTIVRTLEPGGVDIVGATTAPAHDVTIPGVLLSNTTATFARQAEAGSADLSSIVRLLVPGTADAHAEITIVPQTAANTVETTARLTLRAGLVTEVPLGSYPDGSYTIRVVTDQPVVAAARTSTVGTGRATDFAWYAGAAAQSGASELAVAPGPAALLSVANVTAKAATVTLTPTGAGAPIVVTVPANGSSVANVTPGATYSMVSSGRVAASVSYLGDGQLASFAASPPTPVSTPIRVYG